MFVTICLKALISLVIILSGFMFFVCSAYISAARRLSPFVPKELEEYIATAYSSIRQEEAKSSTPHSYTTVRTLLSILRISAVSPNFLLLFFTGISSYLFVCLNGVGEVLFSLDWAKGRAEGCGM